MSLKLEYVCCEICGKDDTELLFTVTDRKSGEKFHLVKCKNCGLIYVNPRPKKNELCKFYTENYAPHKAPRVSFGRKLWHIFIKIFGGRSDLYIINLLEKYPRGRVLDVGCGSGILLKMLKDKGWETYGVDISQIATETARKMGLNVFTGELHDAGFPDKYFDVVILLHSLEHMHNPFEVLKEVYRILKDDGLLVVGVPNIESFEAKVFRDKWFQIDVPRHLYHFSPHSLDLLLSKAGFIRQTIWFDPSPVALANSIAGGRLANRRVSFMIYAVLYPLTLILAKCNLGSSLVITAKKI